MDLNAPLSSTWLIIFVGFFYLLILFYYLERLRTEIKRIEEEEMIRILKKKYEKKYKD